MGLRNNVASLTEEQIRKIIRLHKEGVEREDIAARFGVSLGHISNILSKHRTEHGG